MIVRPLQQKDIDQAVEIARQMVGEGDGYKGIPFEPSAARGWFFAALETPDNVFCSVAEKDGGVVGGMLGCKGPILFSTALQGLELGLYLIPECRKGFTAVRLMNAFEQWAKQQGCSIVQTGVTIGINNHTAAELYRRRGYREVGPVFRKEVV